VPGLVDEAGFLQDDRAVVASHQRIRVVITLYSSCIARGKQSDRREMQISRISTVALTMVAVGSPSTSRSAAAALMSSFS
jgi:hypothetical protein